MHANFKAFLGWAFAGCLAASIAIVLSRRFRRGVLFAYLCHYAWRHFLMFVVCCTVGFYALTGSAYAQTNTPTPTRTPTVTPTPTPTPTGLYLTSTPTPTPIGTLTPMPGTATPNAGGSTIMWGCIMYTGAAPICTWDNYFELPFQEMRNTAQSGVVIKYPPMAGAAFVYLALIPPTFTKQIVMDCSLLASTGAYKSVTLTSNATIELGVTAPSWVVSEVDGSGSLLWVVTSSSDSGGQYDTDSLDTTNRYTFDLVEGYASWGQDGFPSTYSDASDYLRFYLAGHASVSQGTQNREAWGWGKLACAIVDVTRLDDSHWVPTNPHGTPIVATATPGPTVTPGGTPNYPTPWPNEVWVPITSTANAPSMGISDPLTSTCYTVFPGISIDDTTGDGGTVWGWIVSTLGLPDVDAAPAEICTTEYTFDIRLLGINLGAYVLVALGLSAVGVLFSILKSP